MIFTVIVTAVAVNQWGTGLQIGALNTKFSSLEKTMNAKVSSLEMTMDCRLMALEKTTKAQLDAMRAENKTAMAEILSRLSEKKS